METKIPGLTENQARELLLKWGPNKITDPDRVSAGRIVLRQIRGNFIIYLLAVAGMVSFLIGEPVTGYTVAGVILMVVGMSFFQEYRAQKAVYALREMITPVSVVVRDGRQREVETAGIVPGDIVVLRTGERVPADGKILQESDLGMDESVLTGEAAEVEKRKENMIFAGTFVVSGRCLAKMTHTGMNTKFGQIVELIGRSEKVLPLAEKVNAIARFMVVAAVAVSLLTGILLLSRLQVVTTQGLVHVLIVVIALMVSAFPEGLPVVLTTALAVGVSRMAQKNAIVNRMSIIETLGETTVICADKTGTITVGAMMVEKVFASDREMLWKTAVLCSDARVEKMDGLENLRISGSQTEGALLRAAAKEGFFREDLPFEQQSEVPFSSQRKMMAVFGKLDGKEVTLVKGAVEVVLRKCRMTILQKKEVEELNGQWSREAFRVLALAGREGKEEDGLVFYGLVGMADPPRAEVKEALNVCREAGIAVKMITGDHRETAVAVAKEIGLPVKVLEGADLDRMTDEELGKVVWETTIFARVRPEHKLRIVNVLKLLGEVVTMTGDGVNDSPALKEAQIGVAMGIGGTDVSREVSDLTIRDNNFATIVAAVSEGRTIFSNMRKFVSYQLSCNYAELAILFFGVLLAPLFGWQTPVLLALQILFMNLVTDDLPAITFAFNKSSRDVMTEGPRRKAEIINRRLLVVSLLAGILMSFLTLLAFGMSVNWWGQGIGQARTTALVTLILLEIVNTFNFRSFRFRTLNRSPFVNGYLFAASVVSLGLSLLIIYSPIRVAFETVPLGVENWLVAVILSVLFVGVFDLLKIWNNRHRWLSFT